MFKKYKKLLKKLEDQINVKLNDISTELNKLRMEILRRWKRDEESKIFLYVLNLTSDIEFMDLFDKLNSNNDIIGRVCEHLNQISAFIDIYGATDELIELFQTTIEKYKDLHYKETEKPPSCYMYWVKTIVNHKEWKKES